MTRAQAIFSWSDAVPQHSEQREQGQVLLTESSDSASQGEGMS